MTRHDEPNEYGFAGDVALPEPERPHKRDVVRDEAEEAAVPGSDLSAEFREALADSDQVDDDTDEESAGPSSR